MGEGGRAGRVRWCGRRRGRGRRRRWRGRRAGRPRWSPAGGTMCTRLKWANTSRPCLHAATTSATGAAAGPAALNGTSCSRVSRSKTSSMAQNMPSPRTSPTEGWPSPISLRRSPRTSRPSQAERSTSPSSLKMLMLATADAGQRVAAVGEPAGVGTLGEGVEDAALDDHALERHVPAVDALGEADQVRGDVPVVDGEPLAAAAEAGHHLVGDEHDPVVVAQLVDAGEVPGRRDQDPPTTGSRMMAAMVLGPSTMIVSARWRRARSVSSASLVAPKADR